jgi:hypothetical protein
MGTQKRWREANPEDYKFIRGRGTSSGKRIGLSPSIGKRKNSQV